MELDDETRRIMSAERRALVLDPVEERAVGVGLVIAAVAVFAVAVFAINGTSVAPLAVLAIPAVTTCIAGAGVALIRRSGDRARK